MNVHLPYMYHTPCLNDKSWLYGQGARRMEDAHRLSCFHSLRRTPGIQSFPALIKIEPRCSLNALLIGRGDMLP